MVVKRLLRCAAECAGDRLEDPADRGSGRGNRRESNKRDQRDEQRVLEQVLAFFVAGDAIDVCDELRHDILLMVWWHRGAVSICGWPQFVKGFARR